MLPHLSSPEVDPVVSGPQLASPTMAGPDVRPAQCEGLAGVVVGHVTRVEDNLQVVLDISLQADWLGQLQRLSVRDVVRRRHPPASLGRCGHLSLDEIIQ